MTAPVHKSGFRWTMHIFAVTGFFLVFLVICGVVALFVVEIEDVIYADGRIVSELPFDVISHVDGRVIRLNFEEGDDVKEGDVIAEVDPMQYEEEYVAIESAFANTRPSAMSRRRNLPRWRAILCRKSSGMRRPTCGKVKSGPSAPGRG